MSDDKHGVRSRRERDAAKHKPHRIQDRFYRAKREAQMSCESLRVQIGRAQLSDACARDLLRALDTAEAQIEKIDLTRSHPGSQLRSISKEVGHLALAESWLAAAHRVTLRLGKQDSSRVVAGLDDRADSVLWLVRAGDGGGHLTAAVKELQREVQEAETVAARIA